MLDKSKISSDVSWENWNLSRVWSLFWDNDRYCNLEHPFNRFCGNLEYWSVSTYYCSVNKREEFKEEKSSLDVSENIVVPPFVPLYELLLHVLTFPVHSRINPCKLGFLRRKSL